MFHSVPLVADRFVSSEPSVVSKYQVWLAFSIVTLKVLSCVQDRLFRAVIVMFVITDTPNMSHSEPELYSVVTSEFVRFWSKKYSAAMCMLE